MALLATKFYIPTARQGILARPRLVEKLNSALLNPLTLISAPAGYGKTTLLSTWAAACRQPLAWLNLDEGDNDPVRFWRYVDAALQKVEGCLSESLHEALFSARPPDLEEILIELVNGIAASGKKLFLILEDFHVIDNDEIHTGVNFLLDHLPPEIHVVIMPPVTNCAPRRVKRRNL